MVMRFAGTRAGRRIRFAIRPTPGFRREDRAQGPKVFLLLFLQKKKDLLA
jgi:hypothetical protein